ncbi:hypothetical protein CAOG_00835 [Capsaspora owczarzaki ATCC 30864]|uniref:Uncharacterized protein n=1 Tax=Capsaspora owczarzaki (strain ATCC 30864) TaxID=595528 RepID=A0A0D2WJ77_CAPO3|nr:hypothetical protein CAOG_00835 [Capsaspora owczarzaki ATCC 30864]KJE89343.1 hypothetical protein CAOG_000835 [Capsaspora owczarzaki ATCC 30864]|eukprot:XP_004365706.1 hypothetical protein CAOG_00835 [Capsaspora owczarzaki ATCC 30864]
MSSLSALVRSNNVFASAGSSPPPGAVPSSPLRPPAKTSSVGSNSSTSAGSSNRAGSGKFNRDTVQQLHTQLKRLNDRRNKKQTRDNDTEFLKAQSHLSDQLAGYIEELAKRRIENLAYLHKAHEGKVLWFNVVHVMRPDLAVLYANEKHRDRAKSFFHLGLSLGVVLQLPNGQQFVRAVAQLFEEFRYQLGNPAFKGIVSLTKRDKGGMGMFDEDSPVSPEIQFAGNVPQFTYLLTPMMNMHVDYYEVVMCLISSLMKAYEKFLHPSCQSLVLLEAIMRIDARITSYVLDLLIGDMQKISQTVLKRTVMAFKPRKQGEGEQDSEEEGEDQFDESQFDSSTNPSNANGGGDGDGGDADDLDEDDDDDEGTSMSRRGSARRGGATRSLLVDSEVDISDLNGNASPAVLQERLVEQTAILERLREEFNRLDEECNQATKDVTTLSYEVSAQSKIVTMLEEQKKLLEITALAPSVLGQLSQEDKDVVHESVAILQRQLTNAITEHKQLAAELAKQTQDARTRIQKRNAARPGVVTQTKRVESLEHQVAKATELYTGE